MAVLKATDFLAIQVAADTAVVVDPSGMALAFTLPALHSFMSTKDVEITGTVMIMKNPEHKLSGFVCNEIQTLA